MMQELLKESGFEVVVLVKDMHHQMTATLTLTSFAEKLQVLRDIMQVRTADIKCKIFFVAGVGLTYQMYETDKNN